MPKDFNNVELEAGQTIVKANNYGHGWLEVRTVREVKDGKVYLDDSKVAVKFPDRLYIVPTPAN